MHVVAIPAAIIVAGVTTAAAAAIVDAKLTQAEKGANGNHHLLEFQGALKPVNTVPIDLCGVSEDKFDFCTDQIVQQAKRGGKITPSTPSPGEARFDDVPPACMDLAVILIEVCEGDGPRIQTCGSACLHYTDLSPEELNIVLQTFKAFTDIGTN